MRGRERHRRGKTPVVLQQDGAECGLACIAMVAAFHGRHAPLAELRSRCGPSGRGTTLGELMQVAKQLRLSSRPLRVEPDELHRLELPAILHWRMNHFVVLVQCGRRQLVHDPAAGRRHVSREEFDSSFTGVALELAPVRGFRRRPKQKTLNIAAIAGSFRRLYRYLGLMLCLLLCTQVLALAPPIATQILVDELVLGQDRAWLIRALAGLLLVLLAGVMLDGLRRWIALYTGTRLAVDSTAGIMHHLFSLPAEFIGRRHPGDVMSKLESLTPIRHALTDHAIDCVVHTVVLLTTLLVMFVYSGWLTAISVAGFLSSVVLVAAILPACRRQRARAITQVAEQNTSLLESLRAWDVVQGLGLEHHRLAQWQKHFSAATNARVREGRLSVAHDAGTGVVAAFEQVLFLGAGIAGVLDQDLTLGVIFAFMGLRSRFASSALGLATSIPELFLLKVHTERLSDIALAQPHSASPAAGIRAAIGGSVRAEHIACRYPGGRWILRDFSCAIAAGGNVVITGPSGCGKTTLLRILAGQLPANSGQVYVDDRELELWDRGTLRRQTAFVFQDDTLFRGTIAENISSFDVMPDLVRVRAAATIAEIWHDIRAMPMKLDTRVGDMGRNFSGGQVQRLLLARALYRKPAILFLDEATSHLDVSMERRVLQNIARMDVTVIGVAHRPEVIRRAKQIINLNGGTRPGPRHAATSVV